MSWLRVVILIAWSHSTGKTLVLDLYSYYTLYKLKELTPALPPHAKDHIRIFYIKNHCESIVQYLGKEFLYKFKSRKIELSEIIANRKEMVLRIPLSRMRKIADKLAKEQDLTGSYFAYSMWKGYLDKDDTYNNFCTDFGLNLKHIHVSGHAYLDSLQALSEAIKPKQLIPIHTLSGDNFNQYFDNVVRVDDGEPFSVK